MDSQDEDLNQIDEYEDFEYLDEFFLQNEDNTHHTSTNSNTISTNPQVRKSYMNKFKLKVISQYNPNDRTKVLMKIARENNVSVANVKRWYRTREALYDLQRNHEKSVREGRRLQGGGRKETYPELEIKLADWIKMCNHKGIAVKDKYMLNEAKNIAKELSLQNKKYSEFSGSDGWIQNFKRRYNFVSRRITSSRILPENARQKAINLFKMFRD
ncbi:hypothetical protein PVAND_007289 [Polypedilum vanderplanki]|uniref:HTH CENPB-type domain-containing protein n=1 Tax=Polypedilum vanderplanki TaxID=319348 RepID=A0A9J6C604_POLVA|nr:hypothetical protein PVAND_007289 [Polypedilum vanderplanki]